jgi:beta-glucosidase
LSDQQRKFLTEDHLRHVLIVSVENPTVAAEWSNNVQALTESLGHGIPANNSSDPRHGANKDAEYNAGSGGTISQWPEQLGLAATLDPAVTEEFGRIASIEYRALGLTTALSPQIDLATEPRWMRFYGTFGGHPTVATDLARAYVDGFQSTSLETDLGNGWGYQSVNAMVKHWPSGGPEEGGRDGHFAFGKFAVYPGGRFNQHLEPFINGAFKLNGKTKKASAVMPYYTISFDQDTVYGENVGNGFSKWIVTDLLREKYGYEGVVCTDWLITADEGAHPGVFAGKSWGVEAMSVVDRHVKVLEAGLDQFGGNNDAGPVLEAFNILEERYGTEAARARIERSAVRLLTNIFNTGLFENPYLVPEESAATVGKPEFMAAGYEAQLKSITMIKNTDTTLPIAADEKLKVYVPKINVPAGTNFFGFPTPAYEKYPVERSILEKDFTVVDSPEEADFAMAFIKSPVSMPYDHNDRLAGGNGYLPVSLQHAPYTAEYGRAQSIAAGDPVVDPEITNRSYLGKTAHSNSEPDLPMLQELRKAMGEKTVVLVVATTNPMVFTDVEPLVDAILIDFGVQTSAIMDVVTGRHEPTGVLPMQMPMDMQTVEQQLEDVPMDMVPYIDSQGFAYTYFFGLNWDGVICDKRTQHYLAIDFDAEYLK